MYSQTASVKEIVMKRIYHLWIMRSLAHSVVLKFAIIGVLALELQHLVSLKNVALNTINHNSIADMFSYVTYSFTHTQLAVQSVLAIIAAVAAFALVDVIRKDFRAPALGWN